MNVTVMNQLLPSSVSPFIPFAMTDVLTEVASDTGQLFLHFWQLENTLILGMKDTRVTYLSDGLDVVNQAGYHTLVRNSGGLGVISDEGILNISLIFKKNEQINSTDDAYSQMHQLVQRAFPELVIDAKEISNSYCPGTFDLSVNGKKIAGIAQRRLKEGVAVMLYLSVNGNQLKRGEIVKSFYQKGLRDSFGQDGYPPIDPLSMVTVSELLNQELSILDVQNRFYELFTHREEIVNPIEWVRSAGLSDLLTKKETNMIERNDKIKEITHDNSL